MTLTVHMNKALHSESETQCSINFTLIRITFRKKQHYGTVSEDLHWQGRTI